jgi:hypothetical protein
MGTWGIGIASNDTYLEIYSEFYSLYNKGNEISEISDYLLSSNQEIITEKDSTDCHNFWFALAMAQWETKSLTPDTLAKVKDIIESGNDIEQWKQLGAKTNDLSKRKNVLDTFLSKISVAKEKAKPRTKTKPPLFQKGDCVTFKLRNGNYGGVVILQSYIDEECDVSSNLAAATRINMQNEPTLDDFINADVLITNFQFGNDRQAIQEIDWLFQYGKKKVKEITRVVGKIEVIHNFSPEKNYGSFSRLDSWFEQVIEMVPLQYKSELSKAKYKYTKTIKELTQSETWRYW